MVRDMADAFYRPTLKTFINKALVMSQVIRRSSLPATIAAKLHSVRLRQAILLAIGALLTAVSLFVVAMVAAMTIDWVVSLRSVPTRVLLTTTACLIGVFAFLVLFVKPLSRTLGWTDAARSVDDEIPQMEERWTTVTHFASTGKRPKSATAQAMLDQVTSEAVAISELVHPKRIAAADSLQPQALLVAASTLLLLGFLASHWQQTKILLQRFWSPTQPITATQLSIVQGDRRVPEGDRIDLRTRQTGLARESALVTIETESGIVDEIAVAADEEDPQTFLHSFRAESSFRYRVTAGDGETDWKHVRVIDYPQIESIRFTIVSPDYVDRPPLEKELIPRRVKAVAGSRFTLEIKPFDHSDDLAKLDQLSLLLISEAESDQGSQEKMNTLQLHPDAGGWYRFETQLMSDLAIKPILENRFGLTNEDQHTCKIEVVRDKAPVARVINPDETLAVAQDEVIDVRFEAHDDHGIQTAELVVYQDPPADSDENAEPKILKTIPIPLGDQKNKRHLLSSAKLDLSELQLDEGVNISYSVRVTDNRRIELDVDPRGERSDQPVPPNSDGEESFADENVTNKNAADQRVTDQGADNKRADDQGADDPGADDQGADDQGADEERVLAENGLGPTSNRRPQSKPSSGDLTSVDKQTTKTIDSSRTRLAILNPQTSRDGQNTMTRRRKLTIAKRLSAIAEAGTARREEQQIRDRVVAIDEMLAVSQTMLKDLIDHKIRDADRTAAFRKLDQQLGETEDYITDLRGETKEKQFAFVGLQMVDIARTHITPARDRVFVAIRDPSVDQNNAVRAMQGVVRARELLGALLKRYDRVVRDRKLEKSLDEVITMYEVYVEKGQSLMREARQNRNPMGRKMAIIEVDQEYLDRYAEVLTLRREMMRELGRMLADDPRLLSRYLELQQRRRRSLRNRISELAEMQDTATTELTNWMAIDDDERSEVFFLVAETRLETATTLAKDAAELAERIEKQLPLDLDPKVGSARTLVEQVADLARLSREISFDCENLSADQKISESLQPVSRKSTDLVDVFSRLDATFDRLTFEHETDEDVIEFVDGRSLETRTVADQADAWLSLVNFMRQENYAGMASMQQQRVSIETELLRAQMLEIEDQVLQDFARQEVTEIPPEIIQMVRSLQKTMLSITQHQAAAEFALDQGRLPRAEASSVAALEEFAAAERQFDILRRAIVDALDEYDVQDPDIADLRDPTLDEFLAQLEREPDLQARLGIPNRRRNLRVIADTVMAQSEGGVLLQQSREQANLRAIAAKKMKRNKGAKPDPQGQPSSEEAKKRKEAEKKAQERMAKMLDELRKKAGDPKLSKQRRDQLMDLVKRMQRDMDANAERTMDAKKWDQEAAADEADAILAAINDGKPIPDDQWNKLISSLDDGLWQVEGNAPPEEYRKAIEQYQRRLGELLMTNEDDA